VLARIWPFCRSLAYQRWEKVTIDDMHLAFLTAEFRAIRDTAPTDVDLIAHADLGDPSQNRRRRDLLYRRRERLLMYVPATTEWFEVRYLERQHLHQLRAINFGSWTSPEADENEVLKVARRRPLPLTTDPREWVPPILWGHSRKGPFTVLEGNNRLTAYAAVRHEVRLCVRVYVGLSPDPCCWHLPDSL
jgi:hypothetical protein